MKYTLVLIAFIFSLPALAEEKNIEFQNPEFYGKWADLNLNNNIDIRKEGLYDIDEALPNIDTEGWVRWDQILAQGQDFVIMACTAFHDSTTLKIKGGPESTSEFCVLRLKPNHSLEETLSLSLPCAILQSTGDKKNKSYSCDLSDNMAFTFKNIRKPAQ